MAVSVTPNLTLINSCDATTNWSGGAVDTDVKKEGTGCLAAKVSSATSSFTFDLGVQTDLSNNHIRVWMQSTTVGILDTPANGGLRIRVEDAVTGGNFGEWYIGGNGAPSGNASQYVGGWENFIISTAKAFDNQSATPPSLTNIRRVGVTFKTIAMVSGAANNCFWDVLRYGNGLTVGGGTDGDPGTWQNIFDIDDSSSNAYGVVAKLGGVYFVQGKMIFGDDSGTTSTVFKDKGQIVIFKAKPVASTLYEIQVVGNSTGTNKFDIGSVVGSGDDRRGVAGGIIQSASTNTRFKFDSETDTADINVMNLYGVTFKNSAICQFSGTGQDVIGCTFDSCDEIQPNNIEFLNNTIIGPPAVDNALEVTNATNMKGLTFVAETGGATEHHAHFPTATTYNLSGWKFFGFGAAGAPDWHGKNSSAGSVILNSVAGTGTNIAENEIENTGGGTTTVNNTVTLLVTVKDEAGSAISGAQVGIYKASDNSQLMNESTIANGTATEQFNFPGANVDVKVRVRKGSASGTKYVPVDSPQTITSDGLSVTITLIEDTINAS